MRDLSGIARAPFIILALLLSGCSTPTPQNKPEYDQLEIIVWEECINYALDKNIRLVVQSEMALQLAMQQCEGLKPERK